MLLQYQDLYNANKISNGLDAYCRLEGLDPIYFRSMMRAERSRLKSGQYSILGRLFGKGMTHTKDLGTKKAWSRKNCWSVKKD